jgi:ubiquinone/menaquinone biosynthesis C-methylase UbiE
MSFKDAGTYFKQHQGDVVAWWNPETDMGAATFARGLRRVIDELRDAKINNVMDAACGKGRATKELAKYFNVSAVDISVAMLGIVRDLQLPNVVTIEANLENLPFPDNSFDAVVFMAAAVHLDDHGRVFREFFRVLRPNGYLIFDIDNKFGALRMLKNFLDRIFFIFDGVYKKERQSRMNIFWPLSGIKIGRVVRSARFKIARKFYVGILMPFRIKNKQIVSEAQLLSFRAIIGALERFPITRIFSTYIYFICQKPNR